MADRPEDYFYPNPPAPTPPPRSAPAPSRAPAPAPAPRAPSRGVVTPDDLGLIYRTYLGREPTQSDYDIHLTGGFKNNPAGLERSIANSQEAFNYANRPPPGVGGGGFEFPAFEFPSFEMSDQEKRHFDLLNTQIEQQIKTTNEENARVGARRSALDTSIRQQYGMSLEQFEAGEALRSAQTSRAQGERLQKALEGTLPVDPGLERQIGEDESTIRSKLLAQVGPGYETSTPGIQSLSAFKQRAEELRSAARHDEIAAGISPAAASAQFGLSLIGAESPMDTTSIAQGLQADIGSRSASLQGAQARSQALLAAAELAQRERIAQLDFQIKQQQLNAQRYAGANSGGTTQVVRTGAGYGNAAGTAGGFVASAFDPFQN